MRQTALFAPLLLALTACSSSSETKTAEVKAQPSAAAIDACAYLTLEDVREVYGAQMTKSTTDRSFGGPATDVSTCSYEGGQPFAVVTMMATRSKTGSNPLGDRDAYIKAAEKGIPAEFKASLAIEPVDFQGLPALWQAGQLKVFKQGVMLSILADAASGKTSRQTMETLMSKAAGRL